MKSFIALDCEGPITLNDNAFELAKAFIPNGDAFFANVSKYDDFLADVVKREGYKAGDTLKLILPFFKAYGITNEQMEEFSQRSIAFLPGAREMLGSLPSLAPSFIISTSYRPYLEALSAVTGFPKDHIYCTQVDLSRYELSEKDSNTLKGLAQEIASMPQLAWPDGATSVEQLGPQEREVFDRLEEIFWTIIPKMSVGKMFDDINPIGGHEKAQSVKDASRRTGISMANCLYGGDSITDVEAFQMVREEGGITISFNGNSYALRAAEFALIAPTSMVLELIIRTFLTLGPEGFRKAISDHQAGWLGPEEIVKLKDCNCGLPTDKIESIKKSAQRIIFSPINRDNFDQLLGLSEDMRRFVRGTEIGSLG